MSEDHSQFTKILEFLDVSYELCELRKKSYLVYKNEYESKKRTLDNGEIEPWLILFMVHSYLYFAEKFRLLWFEKEEQERAIKYHRPNWDYFSFLDFEMLIRSVLYLAKDSFYQTTQMSHDKGIDLSYSESFYFGTEEVGEGKSIVQCKLYRGTVPTPEVRAFFGVMTSEIAEGYLFTSGNLTKATLQFISSANKSSFANRLYIVEKKKLEKLLEICDIIANCWERYDGSTNEEVVGKILEEMDYAKEKASGIIKSNSLLEQQPRLFE